MLRPYQQQALSEIRENFRNGIRRVLLVMPTGAGKTTVFCEVLKGAFAKENPSIMVVRGRKLVDQAAERLSRESVPHGVIMGNDKRRDDEAIIHAASVDTLFQRKLSPDAVLIVIDEAHLAMSPAFDWLLDQYPDAYVIAVTATPFHKRGFKHMAQAIVAPVTVRQLIDDGYLVPARYFVPTVPDLSTVKKANGDYVLKDLGDAMNQARLFGPIVDTWKEKALLKPTILFAVNVSHSRRLTKAFNEAGIPTAHIDAKTSKAERADAIARLESGEISILSSVGLLITGVDIPCVSCLIIARPTLSYNVHAQMIGRGTRPFPGKNSFIVLDHAGNVPRHGFYETHRFFSLDGRQKPVQIKTMTCESCYCTYLPSVSKACPGILSNGEICGILPSLSESKASCIKSDEGVELREALSEEEIEEAIRRSWIVTKAKEAATRGYKQGWCFFQIEKRYGKEIAKSSWSLIREAYA